MNPSAWYLVACIDCGKQLKVQGAPPAKPICLHCNVVRAAPEDARERIRATLTYLCWLLIAITFSACTQTPPHLTIGPTCPYGTRGCLPAYLPHETDVDWTERVLADHALCRAVPPQ